MTERIKITDRMVLAALEAHDKATGRRTGPYAEFDRRPLEVTAMQAALEAAFNAGECAPGKEPT